MFLVLDFLETNRVKPLGEELWQLADLNLFSASHLSPGKRVALARGLFKELIKNLLLSLEHDHGLTKKRELEVETLGGVIRPRLVGELVEVDMGEPILEGRKIPVNADGKILNYPLAVDGATYSVTCVSMGNPHCVLYVDDVDRLELEKIGPRFEHHPFFPKRVNTEFARVLSPREVRVRVWERGAGETWACGTGACAVGVAGALAGKTEKKITVHLRGGDLAIEWRDNNHVYMTGGAEEVFRGTIKI